MQCNAMQSNAMACGAKTLPISGADVRESVPARMWKRQACAALRQYGTCGLGTWHRWQEDDYDKFERQKRAAAAIGHTPHFFMLRPRGAISVGIICPSLPSLPRSSSLARSLH